MASRVIRKVRDMLDVDDAAIGDGKVPVYRAASGKHEYEAAGGGGGPPSGAAGGVLSGTYPNPGFAADMATQAELDAMLAQAVILAPAASARNVIQPAAGDVIAAVVRAHAAQSVDIWNVQKSDGGKYLRVGATGAVGIGAGTYDPAAYAGFITGFVVSRAADGYWEPNGGPNFTPGASDSVVGSFFDTVVAPTASNPDGEHYGLASTVRYIGAFDASEVRSFSTDLIFRGMKAAGSGAQVALLSSHQVIGGTATGSTGDVTDLYAIRAQAIHFGLGHVATLAGLIVEVATEAAAGPVTVARGLYVPNVGVSNIVTSYGIYVAAQSGSTNPYGIYIAGGKSVFVDTLITGKISLPADADFANGQGGWWWDQANSLPKWKGKTSGGVVVNFVPADATALADHIADPTDAHDASAISFAPTGTVAATDVQAAIAEVASEAAAGGIPGTIMDAKGDLIAATAADTVARLAVGSNGQVLTADSGETTGMKWAAAGGAAAPLPKLSQQWYVPVPVYAAAVTAPTQSRLLLSPMELPAGITLDRLGINQQGAGVASCVFRIGIYSDNGNFYPGALLLDAGTVDLSTAAATKTITISQAIATAGVYWIGGVAQAAAPPTVICVGSGAQQGEYRMPVDSASLFNKSVAFYEASVTGALPATFTATVNKISTGVPNVAVRIQ